MNEKQIKIGKARDALRSLRLERSVAKRDAKTKSDASARAEALVRRLEGKIQHYRERIKQLKGRP